MLFTNISNNKGIADAKRRHHNYLKKTLTVKIIITFLALILTAKNFILISKFYQKISCAIGTVCAPALEGIFYNFNSHKLILTSKANQSVIYILLMTFSWYGSNQRTNLNCSSIKITIPWVLILNIPTIISSLSV